MITIQANTDVLYIEGNPFIIRFKTRKTPKPDVDVVINIEGNPFIIRFKTQ